MDTSPEQVRAADHVLGPGPSTGAVPDDVMADTRADALAVLALWVGRRLFWPLLLLGFAYAWLAGAVTPVALVRLEDPLALLGTLATPLAGIGLAIIFRVVLDLVALAVAFPRTRWVVDDRVRRDGHARGPVRRWVDRLYMTAAYRELRSTWTVRGRSATRLGRSGPWLTALNVLLWVLVVGAGAVLVVAVLETAELGTERPLSRLLGLVEEG